jgi:hypothetical protein
MSMNLLAAVMTEHPWMYLETLLKVKASQNGVNKAE